MNMLRANWLLFVLVLQTSFLSAQTVGWKGLFPQAAAGSGAVPHYNFGDNHFSFGLRVLPMASFVMNQDDYDAGKALDIVPTFRMGVGLHGAYHFGGNVAVAVSPWIGTLGQKYEGMPDTTLLEWDQKMTYLRIPLAVRVNTSPDAFTMFVLETGPELGILTGVETEVATSVQGPYRVVKENFNSTDLSWVLRFGVGFNISDNIKLDFLVSANYGLQEIESPDYKLTRIAGADRRITRNASPGLVVGLSYALY